MTACVDAVIADEKNPLKILTTILPTKIRLMLKTKVFDHLLIVNFMKTTVYSDPTTAPLHPNFTGYAEGIYRKYGSEAKLLRKAITSIYRRCQKKMN